MADAAVPAAARALGLDSAAPEVTQEPLPPPDPVPQQRSAR
jgi:hypothetical protein